LPHATAPRAAILAVGALVGQPPWGGGLAERVSTNFHGLPFCRGAVCSSTRGKERQNVTENAFGRHGMNRKRPPLHRERRETALPSCIQRLVLRTRGHQKFGGGRCYKDVTRGPTSRWYDPGGSATEVPPTCEANAMSITR